MHFFKNMPYIRQKLLIFLCVSIPVAAVSCATAVIFDVEHPPLVDLRNVNSITVIPFEWGSTGEYAYLSKCVTSALIDGVKRKDIVFIDPYLSQFSGIRNYREIADVYITGRISNIRYDSYIEAKDEINIYRNETVKRYYDVVTTYVDIEYSYIRSFDSKVLGVYQKTGMNSRSFEQARDRNIQGDTAWNSGRGDGWNSGRNSGRGSGWNSGRPARSSNSSRRGGRGRRGTGLWEGNIAGAEAAILNFSYTMSRELGPWITTEKRNIKSIKENEPRVSEARRLVRQWQYIEALDIYNEIYKKNSSVHAGYNAAILLTATKKFSDALALLESLHSGFLSSGKNSPAYIRKEITRTRDFVDNFTILESYKAVNIKSVTNTAAPVSTLNSTSSVPDTGRDVRGKVNLDGAMIYALNSSIVSTEDTSVFSKIVASANIENGQWTMRIPVQAPVSLWFFVMDQSRHAYITKTALNTLGIITLNTSEMTRLD